MNQYQIAVAKTYREGKFAWIVDLAPERHASAIHDCGDYLFKFIMRELSAINHVPITHEMARHRLAQAVLDLSQAYHVVRYIKVP